MLTKEDVRGLMSMVPTCALPGADDWRMEDSVDYDEAARVTAQLVKDGSGVLFTNGTTGECATLLWEEHVKFAGVVLDTANKRLPVFCGSTALGTKETIRKLRALMDMGADGTLLGIPMWQAPTLEESVAHYKMVAEAVPGAAIVVYANPRAFRYDYPPAFWRAIHREVPSVIASKYTDVAGLLGALKASENAINFFPGFSSFYPYALLAPETTNACWSHAIQPWPVLAMIDAVKRGDMARAKEIQEDVQASTSGGGGGAQLGDRGQFTLQSEKMTMDAAGYAKAGPIRPPYNAIPQAIIDAAKVRGEKWRQMAERYAPKPVA